MTGVRPLMSIASSSAIVSGRTPDAPCARLPSFSAIISRMTGTGDGPPVPAAPMRTLASFPNPVLMP